MQIPISHLALNLLVAAIVSAGFLATYDRQVLRPALSIGTVDLAEVYRAKEAQFTQLLTASSGEEDRQRALALAHIFAQQLPAALDELPHECRCLVVVQSAVIGGPRTRDLTPALRRKVGLP
ncbi:hypothetical protein [Pseudorhodoferax soli]|uniref:hypothetical protein n=1 Tax=Pseudorhodoferax soli TaxID=545864 RepID=UPI000DF1695F|nr:hypothetical protein [Pseudorhodoferax soli]